MYSIKRRNNREQREREALREAMNYSVLGGTAAQLGQDPVIGSRRAMGLKGSYEIQKERKYKKKRIKNLLEQMSL
jgi:hypothetical protein